ncbi:MAG: hypothetical protein WC310_05505 [Patescibacteria group bacterium]|jgi:hypothetical protein
MGYGAYGSRRSVPGQKLLEFWQHKIKSFDFPNSYNSGHIKIKSVYCKKPECKSCPHSFYAYYVSYWGEKYLGVCDKDGYPREKKQ